MGSYEQCIQNVGQKMRENTTWET